MPATSRLVAAAMVLGVGGCAAVDPRAGLPDVERLVTERGNLLVSAPADPDAAREVDGTVSDLLHRDVTVESAVRIALLNNRGLRALYRELGVPEAELVQAGLLPNPVLTANFRWGTGPSGFGAEMGLIQDVISALQIPLRRRVAKADLERAKLEVAAAVLDLALDTKTAFYRLQGAMQMLELRRTVVTALAISRDLAERRRAAGNITELELSAEQALHEEAKVELAVAEANVLTEREELNALLGLWGEQTQWTMADRLPPLPGDVIPPTGLESLAVSQRLDLEARRTQGAATLAELDLTRVYGLIPSASMGLAAEREIEEGWSVGPAIDIPVPLFDQSQARIARSEALLGANDERLAALAVEIRAEVRRARTRLEAARLRAAYYEAVLLPLQSRLVEETHRQYNAMQIGPLQLLQAKRQEIDVGRRYVETLTEYWLARTEVERAVGGEIALTPGAEAAPAGDTAGSPPAHQDHGG